MCIIQFVFKKEDKYFLQGVVRIK